ncbi:hypothetical protein ACHAW6_002229, partial [Cyclotella cf. meneghiniana]
MLQYLGLWTCKQHSIRYASDYKLGACIVQKGQPVAYFSHKLAKSQRTVMEKEMISIVATLNEFQSMLLSSNIHVFTNQNNLIFDTLKMQQLVLAQH